MEIEKRVELRIELNTEDQFAVALNNRAVRITSLTVRNRSFHPSDRTMFGRGWVEDGPMSYAVTLTVDFADIPPHILNAAVKAFNKTPERVSL